MKKFKNINKSRVYFYTTLFIMIAIFIFSCQNGDESSKSSGFIMELINKAAIFFNIEHTAFFNFVSEYIIRKAAHMTEYAVLCASTILFLSDYEKTKEKSRVLRFFTAIIFCFLYACTDEFHQLFVPERAGQFKDVLIDTCGASIMAVFMALSHSVR